MTGIKKLLSVLVGILLVLATTGRAVAPQQEVWVTTADELLQAVSGVMLPQDADTKKVALIRSSVIVLASGIYDLRSRSINVTRSGLVIRSSGGAEITIIKSTGAAFTIRGDDVTVQGLTISGGEVGIEVTDARHAKVLENMVRNAGIGVRVTRSNDVLISSNRIDSNDVGIELDGATQVSIQRNDIRRNSVGIKVRNSCSVTVQENNIARNEVGIDASEASCPVHVCTDNWWPELGLPRLPPEPPDFIELPIIFPPPSRQIKGPIKVQHCPLPRCFESLTADKTDVVVGDVVTLTYTSIETSTEKCPPELTVTIEDDLGNVVNQFSREVPVDPQGHREATFSYIFQTSGVYTVTAATVRSTKSVTVTVAVMECLPFALDTNKNNLTDDEEIIAAVDLWIKNSDISGCVPPRKISDTEIIKLIDAWIKQAPLSEILKLN